MMPSDMNLKIKSGAVGYNNKIFISDGTFSLGKNDKVNAFKLAKINHKALQAVQPTITHNQKPRETQTDEKIAVIIFIAGVCAIWNMFQ